MSQFETRAERRARLREERRVPSKSSPKWLWWVLVLVVIGGGTWWAVAKSMKPQTPAQIAQAHERLVDSCTTDMATTFHIHAHLTIIINGQEKEIPANTGISSTCMHSLHTHDTTGIIHIESPRKEDFTLGDFFKIWGQTFTPTQLFDSSVDTSHQLKLFADGKEITTGPATVMKDHVSYALVFADAKTTITPPANYQFPSDL